MELKDKIIVITGAASGIGEGMARTFAAEGMHVVVSDVEGDRAESVSASLRETGVRSIAIQTDVVFNGSIQKYLPSRLL